MELLLAYLHLIKTDGEVTKTELLKKSKASDAQLKGLIEKDILIAEKKYIDRIKYLPRNINIDFELSSAQQKALETARIPLMITPFVYYMALLQVVKHRYISN